MGQDHDCLSGRGDIDDVGSAGYVPGISAFAGWKAGVFIRDFESFGHLLPVEIVMRFDVPGESVG